MGTALDAHFIVDIQAQLYTRCLHHYWAFPKLAAEPASDHVTALSAVASKTTLVTTLQFQASSGMATEWPVCPNT